MTMAREWSSRLLGVRRHLEVLLRHDARLEHGSEEVLQRKIDHFYMPLFEWSHAVVEQAQRKDSSRQRPSCVCIGLSCVQGGGKTTTTRFLEELFGLVGKKCAVMSLDDVYFGHSKLLEVAAANASNPLLQFRGNPGTQDIPLLLDVIRQCRSSDQNEVAIPQYDKSLNGGRGDRLPPDQWKRAQGPLDVLFIEGWCMGFHATLSDDALPDDLKPVNAALREFEDLYAQLDAMIVFKVGDASWVYKWREEQEQHLRAANKPSLSTHEVRDFVDRFMPAYRAYLPALYAPANAAAHPTALPSPSPMDALPQLVIEIDSTRCPVMDHPPVELNFSSNVLTRS